MVPNAKDLHALAKFYGYEDAHVLMLEGVVVPRMDGPETSQSVSLRSADAAR